MAEQLVGHVTHWFARPQVAGVHIDHGVLRAGDKVHIVGHTSDVEQPVISIEVEHQHVVEAREGDEIGIKVLEHVREGDKVYLIRN